VTGLPVQARVLLTDIFLIKYVAVAVAVHGFSKVILACDGTSRMNW
jgi:hypothetical protein